ncbi:MAG: hypothetical protein ABIM89_17435 [Mycobacteriales bacterium]
MRDLEFDLDLNEGGDCAALTITSPEVLVQVSLLAADLIALAGIRSTRWSERNSIRLGTCSGLPVHWCAGELPVAAFLPIGDDPEVAQMTVVLTEVAVVRLLELVAKSTG